MEPDFFAIADRLCDLYITYRRRYVVMQAAPELEAGETYTLLLNGEAAASALSVTGESNGQPSGQTIHNANTATGAGIWLWAGLGVCAALSLPAVLLLRRRDRRENRG